MRIGSAEVGDINRAAVLRVIGREGPIARVDIAKRLSLSPATVTGATRGLAEQGLISVVEHAPPEGGRPPLLLGLNAFAAQATGVKIGPDRLVGVRATLNAEVLERFEHPFDPAAPDPVGRIAEALRPHLAKTPED